MSQTTWERSVKYATPSTARVVGRGTVLGVACGAASGATLWIGGCVVSGAPAGILLGFLAALVGAIIGAPVGLLSTGPLLAVRDRHGEVRAPLAAFAGAALPAVGSVTLAVAAVSGSEDTTTFVIWGVVIAMAITSGAVAGPLALRPVVSARPSDAAGAAGTTSPGSSRAPGR